MSTKPDDHKSAASAGEDRRWLIGIGISLVFGLFGVVMALLSYSDRTRPLPHVTPTNQGARAPAADLNVAPKPAERSSPGRRKDRGRD